MAFADKVDQNTGITTSSTYCSQERFEQQLLSTIVAGNLSFQIVENPEFHALVHLLRPSIEVPGRKRMRELLQARYESVAASMFADLGPTTKVSIALDCWSSPNRLSFLAITAYYFSNDWKYNEVLIGFEHVSGPHTGRNLAQIVERVLVQYSLLDRLFAVTTDNASNNNTLRRTLEQIFQSHNIVWNADTTRVNCLAHVLNLSAQALLLGLKVAAESESFTATDELTDNPLDLSLDLAANDIARTVVKESIDLRSFYYSTVVANILLASKSCGHDWLFSATRRVLSQVAR